MGYARAFMLSRAAWGNSQMGKQSDQFACYAFVPAIFSQEIMRDHLTFGHVLQRCRAVSSDALYNNLWMIFGDHHRVIREKSCK